MTLTTDERRARSKAQWQRYYREHRKELIARAKKPEALAKTRERTNRRRDPRPSVQRDYKLSKQEKEAGRRKPDHCEICGGSKQRIAFDHCHQTGVFRGWICIGCNSVLGYVNDDINRLRQLIAYLERTKDEVPRQFELPV